MTRAEQRQVAKTKNQSFVTIKIDARTKKSGGEDALPPGFVYELNGPLTPEKEKELIEMLGRWREPHTLATHPQPAAPGAGATARARRGEER